MPVVKVKVKLLSRVQLFSTPWTVAYQAPPSMEFSRKEYWTRLSFPSPGDLPNPGIEPVSPVPPALQADSLLHREALYIQQKVFIKLLICARSEKVKQNLSVMSDSLQLHGLQPTRLLRPWNFPGKSTGVGYYFLLQGIFPTQGSN